MNLCQSRLTSVIRRVPGPASGLYLRLPHMRPMSSGSGSAGRTGCHHSDGKHTVDPRVGTVSVHRHHLVVCNSSSAEWPSKVEGMSPTITALAAGAIRLPGRAMVTLSDFAPFNKPSCACSAADSKNKYDRIDVAVFPLGLVAQQLDTDGVRALLDWLGHDVLPTSWTPTHARLPRPPFAHRWLELTTNRHIFVCTHGSRDRLCGEHGGKLLDDLRSLIGSRGLAKHLAAWSTSHIGGHKYAANAIVYPRGDWYGTWCDQCSCSTDPGSAKRLAGSTADDAQAIIDAATRDAVWWDAWRGAVNMSKQDQIATWRHHNVPGHVHSTGSQTDTHQPATQQDSDKFTAWTPKTSKRSSSSSVVAS